MRSSKRTTAFENIKIVALRGIILHFYQPYLHMWTHTHTHTHIHAHTLIPTYTLNITPTRHISYRTGGSEEQSALFEQHGSERTVNICYKCVLHRVYDTPVNVQRCLALAP